MAEEQITARWRCLGAGGSAGQLLSGSLPSELISSLEAAEEEVKRSSLSGDRFIPDGKRKH